MNIDNFLWTCKELYLKEVHPFDFDKMDSELYQKIIQLGKNLIKEQGLQEFLEFLMENQYRVYLWAAILGLDYGNPKEGEILAISGKDTIIDHCIETVNRHVHHKTTDEQAKNGKDWVDKMKTRYNKTEEQ